jgi:hypothetical protein
MVFSAATYLAILGGIFGLLELTNISNIFKLFIFPLLIITFSLIVFVYSKNKTEGVSVAISTSRIISEMYKSHDEIVELIGVISELDVRRDQDGIPEKEKYSN